jgi:hypothetical protein
MYKELFYLISTFVKRFKSVREPEFSTFVFISILITLNFVTVFTFLGYFTDINLYRDYNINYIYVYLPLCIFIMVVNYITIYSKRHVIIEKYNFQNGINKYKSLLYKFYLLASFVLLLVSYSLNQTLFEKNVKMKEQEKIQITVPKLDPKGDPSKTY